MATRFSNTLHCSNTASADFQAWIQFVDNTLVTTGGWVNTADTGQLVLASATSPGAANTKVGFRIYHMNDTLQATVPVFMRIDYGSSSIAGTPGMWITIGTGSNGTGTITGVLYNGGATTAPTVVANDSATTACDSYGSADTNRCSLLMFVRTGAVDMLLFSIERSKDSSGNDTSDGLLLTFMNVAGNGVDTAQYVLNTGSQPPSELATGVAFILNNHASSAFTSNVGIGLPLHFKSVAQQPGMGVVVVNDGDFVAEATFTMSLYSNTHTFQLGNSSTSQVSVPTGNAGKSTRANTRMGIRYE